MVNEQKQMPFPLLFFAFFVLVVGIWFAQGGSFRLYGSLFFSMYHLVQNSWIVIILVAVVQNLAFLPLRFIGEMTWPKLKAFEDELSDQKNKEEQGFLLKKKVQSGDWPTLIYSINFLLLLIAFVSAGRFFLLDFYSDHHKIDASKYLYGWVPYPEYPLKGTHFPFPWLNVTQTIDIPWINIVSFWAVVFALLFVPRMLWKWIRNSTGLKPAILVNLRIKLNRIHYWLIGIIGSLFIASIYLFRNFPSAAEGVLLSADISKQNTSFNIITALATFVATIFMGNKHNKEQREHALKNGLSQEIVDRVHRESTRTTLRNAFLIAVVAYFLTHLMPCSHDLSVLAFEAVYIIASYTIDPLVKKNALKMGSLANG